MEVVEIVSFHINRIEEILEVSFRTNSDDEEVIRESKIPFTDIDDFGYKFHNDTHNEFINEEEDMDFYDDFEDDDLFVDENEILSFLNEYYILFIDKLPKAELF